MKESSAAWVHFRMFIVKKTGNVVCEWRRLIRDLVGYNISRPDCKLPTEIINLYISTQIYIRISLCVKCKIIQFSV